MKIKTLLLSTLMMASFCGHAAAQSLSTDYQSMMQWLTNETAQGLAFNTGSTFDPPSELRPWRLQPDVSLGIGVVPINKSKFPELTVPALAALDPAHLFPSHVMFPNLTLHMRLGLPNRWDVSFRGVDMTVPPGYQLTPSTIGNGQSNTLGLSVRRHFLGGDMPLLSVAGNYNHVFGHFNFSNQFKNLGIPTDSPQYYVDAQNQGQLAWDVSSIGLNTVLSQTFGIWTPFAGVGYNHMSGSISGRLATNFSSELVLPVVGEASARAEPNSARGIFGVQMDGAHLSLFLNGEIKALGAAAGQTFIISSGFVAPFGFGASSVAKKSVESRKQEKLAYESLPRYELLPDSESRQPKKQRPQREDAPPLIFIR